MKKENGVTLVALVVTIIVLIILAGISINLVLGDNGIITIAKRAKENTELARIEEETELNELYDQLISEGSNSGNLPYDSIAKLTEFKTAIANAINEAGGVKTDISAETAVFTENIKGILKEVTKNATATAEDITKGKTAYINGELITGVGNILNNQETIVEQVTSEKVASGTTLTVTMPDGCKAFLVTRDDTTGVILFKNTGERIAGDGYSNVQVNENIIKFTTEGSYASVWKFYFIK